MHLVVRITAPPAFCYLPYFIRLSQKELQDQFKESFCCLAPSGSSLDRNIPFTSSLQRLSKVLNFCIIVSFALSFVKPKVGKKTACRQSEYKTQKTAPGKLPKAVLCRSYCGRMEDVAYATRRRGKWLLKQPRLGARMCQGTSFFILRCLLQPLLLSLRFLFPVRLREPAHILQTHIRIRRVRRSWNGDLCSSHTDWRSEHPLQ